MGSKEFKVLELCMKARAFRLLGIFYKKQVTWYKEIETGDIVFKYM
jgi:hypothetical protein